MGESRGLGAREKAGLRGETNHARDLFGKASRATVSARLFLDAGDVNGACNRAYYAMCDA